MNVLAPYHSPDVILTEALVNESTARAANLKSMTLRNVLFGTAALVGALLIGWAALKWADNQGMDPAVLREALANMPELRVAPVQIAKDSEIGVHGDVGMKPGGEVTLAQGATVGIDPGSTVEVRGSVKQGSSTPLPDVSKQPTKTENGDAIKREVVVFTEVPWKGGTIVSGWRFSNGASKRPYLQYCYHSTPTSDTGATEDVVYLIRDGVDFPVPPFTRFNAVEARSKCVQWRG